MNECSPVPPAAKPPALLNSLMTVMLKTPGIQRVVGKAVALLTFEGRRSGRMFTIPISYQYQDGEVIMVTKKSRTWWRNLPDRPHVTLRLAGREVQGRAQANPGASGDLDTMMQFLRGRKVDAKAYGLELGPDGRPDEPGLRRLLPHIVIIRIQHVV